VCVLSLDARSQHVANLIAVVMPWVIALPFYSGQVAVRAVSVRTLLTRAVRAQGLVEVTVWSSLAVNGIINFVVPILFYIMARDVSKEAARAVVRERRTRAPCA
jgi:hypothetical protein